MSRFQRVSVSIWGQGRYFAKSSMSPVVITKIWQLEILPFIVLMRDEVLNLYVRSRLWVIPTPISQSSPYPWKWEYINFFETISILAGNHLVVPIGASHISLWPQEIQSREWEKKNKEQTNNMVWVGSKCKKRSYVTLHFLYICRLTLAWISSKISTKLLGMPTHLDWSSLAAAGLYLMRLVSSGVQCRHQLPLCVSCRQLPSVGSFFQLLSHSLTHFRSRRRSRAQAFVWFRAKTDKGIICLVPPFIVSHMEICGISHRRWERVNFYHCAWSRI